MRRTLEFAVLTYVQEGPNLLMIAGPALLLAPVLVLIADASLQAALTALPLFLLLYLAAYAACVQATRFVLTNLSPDPGLAYVDLLPAAPHIVRAAAPAGLALAVTFGTAIVLANAGQAELATATGVAGLLAFFLWAARHCFDQTLVLAYGLSGKDAQRLSTRLAERDRARTASLLAALAAPLLPAALLSWALAAAVTPALGGAAFAAALAVWLPLPAIALTHACAELVAQGERDEEEAPEEYDRDHEWRKAA